MIQISPLWLNNKQLNLNVRNIVPRVETKSESMSAFFGKIGKSGYWIFTSKNGCCFFEM